MPGRNDTTRSHLASPEILTVSASTGTMLSEPNRPEVFTCFNELPVEVKLTIIKIALEIELAIPSTTSLHVTNFPRSTKFKALRVPPLFQIDSFFRQESFKLAAREGLLIPILSASRSTYMSFPQGRKRYSYHNLLLIALLYTGKLVSNLINTPRPSRCLFNPDHDLLELDPSHPLFWLNAVMRLSPEMRAKVRYMLLVSPGDVLSTRGRPTWKYLAYGRELNKMPGLMPNLELVILKKKDFTMQDYHLPILKYLDWDTFGLHFMRIEDGMLLKSKHHSDAAIVWYYDRWKQWSCDANKMPSRRYTSAGTV